VNDELSLCGLVISRPENFERCLESGITEDHFFDEKAKKIWRAITEVMLDDALRSDAFVAVYSKCSDIASDVVAHLLGWQPSTAYQPMRLMPQPPLKLHQEDGLMLLSLGFECPQIIQRVADNF
jgi:hypothetical protein